MVCLEVQGERICVRREIDWRDFDCAYKVKMTDF